MDDLDRLIVETVGDERDPYPDFAEHRKSSPVDRSEGFAGEGVYSVYRYGDVARVLREPDDFSSRVYVPAVGLVFGPSILQMDGSEHHRRRGLIGGSFRRRALEAKTATLIEPTVHALIDAFAAGGRAELVRELTIRYPIQIISGLLGIPPADHERFTVLSLHMIGFAHDIERGIRASNELKEYFARILAERRREPGDDLISELARADIGGEPVGDEEIFGFLRLLLPAGAETTYRLLGNLLFALLTNPAQLDAVRADRALLPRAIEEALRWESPVQYISREATRDVTIAGVDVPAGSHVSCALGSANHDETVFADPERYDLFAERAPHLAFAEGPHRCLGEHLARLETTVALNALFDRLPDLRLDTDGGEAHVQGVPFRSPNRLPVTFRPA